MTAPFAGATVTILGVWPVYVGLTEDPAGRAQITWRHDGGEIVGSARIPVAPGTYSQLHYFHTSDGPASGGSVDIEPIVVEADGVIDVDPITV